VARFAGGADHDTARLFGPVRAHCAGCGAAETRGDPAGSGSGSNPDLKPIKSDNLDAGLEWYFAPRSLLSATVFYMKLKDYVTFRQRHEGIRDLQYCAPPMDSRHHTFSPCRSTPTGRVTGVEVAYQAGAHPANFGVAANYTYADGQGRTSLVTNGDDRLVGTSKNTFNVSGYYENRALSARASRTPTARSSSAASTANTAFSQGRVGHAGRLARLPG